MKTELFDYALPEALIAQRPLASRSGARLLVLDREILHRHVEQLPDLVPEGALMVLNDTRVRRARVLGTRRPNAGRVELLMLSSEAEPCSDGRERWRALGRASKALRPGTCIDAGELAIEVLQRDSDGSLLLAIACQGAVEGALERAGRLPIPPYMRRTDDVGDDERYQTVYARRAGSAAAPTAGLHFTEALLLRLQRRGVQLGYLELQVGLGTFRPVSAEDLNDHSMHEEAFEVSAALAQAVREARERRAKVVAVGTTVVRALESAADPASPGLVRETRGSTRLMIQPGYRFQVVDALFTNFHQPRSTLLALVAAFAGYQATMAAYAEALREQYRFLSYGDAMWIPRRRA